MVDFKNLRDAFPFGPAPLIILLLAAVAGGFLAVHPIPPRPEALRVWTFARSHWDAYQAVIPSFEAAHPGVRVANQLVHGDSVTSRLRAALWADLEVPDLAEIEISVAGSFFRGPVDEVGFVDLTPFLTESGLMDRVVRTRLAPYTNRGRIFGLPHDVHPVMLAYRRDLFEQLGIDVSAIRTWDDFVAVGRRITKPGERYMIQLTDANAGNLEMFLFQQDAGYFDAEGRVIMDSDIVFDTIKWYVPLLAGPDRIANDPGDQAQAFSKALEDGYILSFLCPDWRSRNVENDVPRLSGKMALMPLPAFRPGGRRTSTLGGTMLGMTRKCQNKQLAWQLARHLYIDTEELAKRFRQLNILPPVRDAWSHPAFAEPRAYWSGQPIGRLYADLAEDVPPQYTSPFIHLAKRKLGTVVASSAAYYRSEGERGFDDFLRRRLRQVADEVREQMKRNPF